MKFKKGESIRVKQEISDPDYPSIDISGWQGRIVEFDGEDEDQLKYVIKKYEESEIKPKLILTGGSPIKLEEEYKLTPTAFKE
jgi:hypothetical protein